VKGHHLSAHIGAEHAHLGTILRRISRRPSGQPTPHELKTIGGIKARLHEYREMREAVRATQSADACGDHQPTREATA
jgi:hypothetical protein